MFWTSVSQDSVFGIAIRYGLEGPLIESRWDGNEIFRSPPDRPFFSSFFNLDPVCLSSGFTQRSLVAYCATLNYHSAQIQYPCVSYKETEVLN